MNFTWERKETQIEIKLPAEFTPDLEADWDRHAAQWMLEPATQYVLDFVDVKVIKPAAYRLLLSFCQTLAKAEKAVYSVHIAPALLKQLKSDGVAQTLNPPTSRPLVDLSLLNHFITATQKTVQIQASTPCQAEKAYVLKAGMTPPEKIQTDIAGVLSINSDKFRGSLTLCFPKGVFLKIYSNMLGESQADITDDTKDAAAELLNIIYGTAKVELNKGGGFDLKPALPTVITGEKLSVRQNNRSPVLCIPFATEAGKFQLEIVLEAA